RKEWFPSRPASAAHLSERYRGSSWPSRNAHTSRTISAASARTDSSRACRRAEAPRSWPTGAVRAAVGSRCRSTRSSLGRERTRSVRPSLASFAFGRDRRLRRRSDFLRVQSTGERATSRYFVFLLCPQEARSDREAPGPSRLGIVVTRKVGSATQRNRIK